MPQKIPQPPSNNTEVFKAQLEYYQQLRRYHHQEMMLAQEKFDRLRAFLELELSDFKLNESQTLDKENVALNTTVQESTKPIIVEQNYSEVVRQQRVLQEGRSDTNHKDLSETNEIVTDSEFKSNQQTDTKVETKELSINDSVVDKIDSRSLEVKASVEINSDNVETLENTDSSFVNISTITTTEASLPHKSENNNKQDNLPETSNQSSKSSKELLERINSENLTLWQLVAAILDDNAPEPMNKDEILQAFSDKGLTNLKWKISKESIASILSNYQKKKLWMREKEGYYRSTKPQKISFSYSNISKTTSTTAKESTEFQANSNNTPLYQIIVNALRSVAPNPMNASDIVNWMYPKGVSSKIWQKTRDSITKALSNNLSKNLWERVATGYYRIKNVEEKVAVVLPAQDNFSEKESLKSQEEKSSQGLELEENEAIYLKIKHLNGYAGVVRAAMKARADLVTTPIDVCNWLDSNLSDSLKQELYGKFQKALAKDAQRGRWERIDVRTYKYSSELNSSKNNNISEQTALELNSASTKPISQQLKELTPLISELFESEGNGMILHQNYIGHTIFGTNYRDRLPQLLEMLALGQKQNLWARVPEDPDCWTLDLSLLPTEEIEIIEEDSSAEPTLQPI